MNSANPSQEVLFGSLTAYPSTQEVLFGDATASSSPQGVLFGDVTAYPSPFDGGGRGGGAFHVSLCPPRAWGVSYLHFSSLEITP